ncbi:hypothetical protein HDU86_000313 [Geranomyces michiganensis]|nr:hypothetical protein HDU86_000313 [Geranomyces michiganensis]
MHLSALQQRRLRVALFSIGLGVAVLPAATRAQVGGNAAATACEPLPLLSPKACGVVRDTDLPMATSISAAVAAEAKLQALFTDLKPFQTIAPACYGYLRQIYCGSVFPGCKNGNTVYPCASTCQFATDACLPVLSAMGKEHLLPDCAQGVAASANSTRSPYPVTQCLGSTAPGAKITVLDSQATTIGTAMPATVYSEGVDPQVIILMALYFNELADFPLVWVSFLPYPGSDDDVSQSVVIHLAILFHFRRLFPVIGWAMSTLPFVIVFALSAAFFGGHAAYHLYQQRAAFDSTSASVFLGVCAVANYQQVRAVFRGTYNPSDSNPGVREYMVAAIGIIVWLVLCTSSATWSKTLAGSLFAATFRGSSGSRSDPRSRSTRSQTKSELDDDMIELRSSPTQYSAHRSATKMSAISGPFLVSTGQTVDAPQKATTRQNTQMSRSRSPGPYEGGAPLTDGSNSEYYANLYAAAADSYSDQHWATRRGTERSDRSLIDDGFEGASLPSRENPHGSGVRPPRRKKSAASQRSYGPEGGHGHFAEEIPAVPPLSINTSNFGSEFPQRFNSQRSPVSPSYGRYRGDSEPSPVAGVIESNSRPAARSRSQSRGRREAGMPGADAYGATQQRAESPLGRSTSQRRYYDA